MNPEGRLVGPKTARVFTHARPAQTRAALTELRKAAVAAGWTLLFDPDETAKHTLSEVEGVLVDSPPDGDERLAVVLGGDGTILAALRHYAGTGVPVFAVNFGEIGFLATVEPGEVERGFRRAFDDSFQVLELPALMLSGPAPGLKAMNDISLHRKQGGRVAVLAYAVGEDEIGRVRADGLVVSTPAGSTGYNLANGGPVMAWGVEGYVVSFIAPHSLTARALVVAPDDPLVLRNCSRGEPVDVSVDGRPVCELGAGEAIELRFAPGQGHLAQIPGASFYHRLRQKFGRLAS